MSGGSVRVGVQAAILLAQGRVDGLDLVTAETPSGQHDLARHSFLAAALCLPPFVLVQLLGATVQEPDAMLASLARDLAAFALGWLGFAVLTHRIASALGRAALWPRFITLWNWCNLVQYLMLGASVVPALLGVPGWVAQTAWIVAMGWAVWLEWSATRLALGLPGGTAAALVALDMLLGLALLMLVGAGG